MSKITLYILCISFLCVCGLFTMWQITSAKLKTTRNDLEIVQNQVQTLKTANDNLVIYLQQRDTQIKNLEVKYQQVLNNVPADICGDTKPSKELLEYFKSL